MTGNRFKLNDGIINESPHGEGQPPKRHDVQCDVSKPEPNERDKNRKRDGDENNKRPSHVSKKDHYDDHREQSAKSCFTL